MENISLSEVSKPGQDPEPTSESRTIGRSVSKKRSHFPKLREYLEHVHKNSPLERAEGWLIGLGVGGSITALVASGLATAITNTPAMMLGGLAALGVVWTGWVVMYRNNFHPRDEAKKALVDAHKAAKKMLEHVRGRRLHRFMDVATAEVLEACAFHWSRIRSALDSPAWNPDVLEGHWFAVRDQALRASDEAMLEAIYLARAGLSEKRMSGSPEFLEWAEDFFDVDVDDLLKKFGVRHGSSEEDVYGYQPALLRPLHQIGTKLRTLADEMEKAPAPSARPMTAARQSSASAIDLTLSEIGALKKAERELNDSIQQRLDH